MNSPTAGNELNYDFIVPFTDGWTKQGVVSSATPVAFFRHRSSAIVSPRWLDRTEVCLLLEVGSWRVD